MSARWPSSTPLVAFVLSTALEGATGQTGTVLGHFNGQGEASGRLQLAARIELYSYASTWHKRLELGAGGAGLVSRNHSSIEACVELSLLC